MTKRNYTLIELLTVLFIIGVLAGLVFPATALVRSKARRTACASNLKQVGALAMQFSNDRDGQIPMYQAPADYNVQKKKVENYYRKEKRSRFEEPATATTAISDKTLWTVGLLRYAKYNMSVFFCPADERGLNVFTTGNSSYSLNYGDADRPGGATGSGRTFTKMSQVTRSPAGVILLAETDEGQLGMDTTQSFGKFFNNNKNIDRKPHSNEYNVAFLDGHAEFLRPADMQRLYDNDGFKIK